MGDEPQDAAPPTPPTPRVEKPPATELRALTGSAGPQQPDVVVRSEPKVVAPPSPKPKVDKPPAKEDRGV